LIEYFIFRLSDGEIVSRVGVGDEEQLTANIPDDCGHILATIPGVPDETYKVDLETLELVEK